MRDLYKAFTAFTFIALSFVSSYYSMVNGWGVELKSGAWWIGMSVLSIILCAIATKIASSKD